MSAFEQSQKTQRTTRSFETKVIRIGMIAPLFFSGWLIYHFVKPALVGLMQLVTP
jgi:hypothetical protein